MKRLATLVALAALWSAPAFATSNVYYDDQTRMDYSGTLSGSPIYVGHAKKGTADSGAWRVCKYTDTVDGPTLIQCTDGAWTDRASLSYS